MAISLIIRGNKRTNEGIGAPLVAIGTPFPTLDEQYPGVPESITDFIVVRHLIDKSIYTIACRNVVPSDSNREGRFYISVSIPVEEKVDDMFSLLIELQNCYKTNCMQPVKLNTPHFAGNFYRFSERPDNPAMFEEIIARHRIEPYPFKPIATAPDTTNIAYIFKTPQNIAAILADPMRPEFTRFGQIVLVPIPNEGAIQSTIEIPASILRVYKLFVNGKPAEQTISDPLKTFNITLPETAKLKAASLQFSLNHARAHRVKGVVVDDRAQVIYVNITQEEKENLIINNAATQQSKSAKKRILFLCLAIGLLLLIGGGAAAYFLFINKPGTVDPVVTNNDNNDSITALNDSTNKANPDSIQLVNSEQPNGDGEGDAKTKETTSGNSTTVNDNNSASSETKPEEQAPKKDLKKLMAEQLTILKNCNGTFKTYQQIYNESKQFKGLEGFDDFAKLAAFHVKVIDTLKNATDSKDYREKINQLIQEANKIPETETIAALLKERISGAPSKINENFEKDKTAKKY